MTRDEQIQTLGLAHAHFGFDTHLTYIGHTEIGDGKLQLNYTFVTNLPIYDRYKDEAGIYRTQIVISEEDLIDAEEPFTPEEGEYVIEEFDAFASIESIAVAQYDPAELQKLKKAAIEFAALDTKSARLN